MVDSLTPDELILFLANLVVRGLLHVGLSYLSFPVAVALHAANNTVIREYQACAPLTQFVEFLSSDFERKSDAVHLMAARNADLTELMEGQSVFRIVDPFDEPIPSDLLDAAIEPVEKEKKVVIIEGIDFSACELFASPQAGIRSCLMIARDRIAPGLALAKANPPSPGFWEEALKLCLPLLDPWVTAPLEKEELLAYIEARPWTRAARELRKQQVELAWVGIQDFKKSFFPKSDEILPNRGNGEVKVRPVFPITQGDVLTMALQVPLKKAMHQRLNLGSIGDRQIWFVYVTVPSPASPACRAFIIATPVCVRCAVVPSPSFFASSIAALNISGPSVGPIPNFMPSILFFAAQRTHSRACCGVSTGPLSQPWPTRW